MNLNQFGYTLGVLGTVIILIWVGLFKFTAVEAGAIKGLVENHFAMSWMYRFLSVQQFLMLLEFLKFSRELGCLFRCFLNELVFMPVLLRQ